MKVLATKLSEKERIATLDALYTAAGAIRGRSAMKLFLRDLLTESERIMLGRRITIAQRILSGATYDDIATGMKVGYDTIRRVHRWLEDQFPGYEQAVKGMEKTFQKRKNIAEANAQWKQFRRRYPLHSLLFNILSNPFTPRRKKLTS